jgi:hypothetical protein
MINIKYNINTIIKGGGFRGNLGSPDLIKSKYNING